MKHYKMSYDDLNDDGYFSPPNNMRLKNCKKNGEYIAQEIKDRFGISLELILVKSSKSYFKVIFCWNNELHIINVNGYVGSLSSHNCWRIIDKVMDIINSIRDQGLLPAQV